MLSEGTRLLSSLRGRSVHRGKCLVIRRHTVHWTRIECIDACPHVRWPLHSVVTGGIEQDEPCQSVCDYEDQEESPLVVEVFCHSTPMTTALTITQAASSIWPAAAKLCTSESM